MIQALSPWSRLRIAALLIAGSGVILRGVAYIHPPESQLLTWVDGLIPLQAWSAIWIAVGVVILAGIWSRDIARWGMSAGAALCLIWAAGFILSWITGDSTRGWVTGTLLATTGGLMVILAALIDQRPGRTRGG